MKRKLTPRPTTASRPASGRSPSPALARVRQRFPASAPLDFGDLLNRQLPPLIRRLKPNARIAIAVGSRGIANLQPIVAALVRVLRAARARPFILPAMGSHGGATPAGQAGLLAEYGITQTALGVPVRSSMAVRSLGQSVHGLELVCSVEALRADGIVLVNRIKPHTDFGGALGSGLQKMLVVGLGKQVGAARFHAVASRFGHLAVLQAAARVLLRSTPVLAGIAILENQRHETARLEVVRPRHIPRVEPELCAEAHSLMPRLPFDEVDLLIVDCMGKNISGTGMDPAVIGRMIHGYSLAEDVPQGPPRVRRLFVRDLAPASHGNAIGIGLADFTTTRLVQAMDRRITALNALTALSLQGAKLPLYFDTDREAIERALATLALPDPRRARIVRIRDTLSLEELQVSEVLLVEVRRRRDLEVTGEPAPIQFDAAGNLSPM